MKLTKIAALLIVLFCGEVLVAQNDAVDFGLDQNDFIYVAGNYNKPIDLGDNNLLNIYGESDIFLGKYDSKGKCQWATRIGGRNTDNVGGIFVEKSGAFYVTGAITGVCKFGPVKAQGSSSKLYPSVNFFLAKYNTSGDPIWIKISKNQGMDAGTSIAGDDNGNIYVTGVFDNTMVLDGQSIKSSGKNDAFVLKVNSSGNTLWLKSLGDKNDENAQTIFTNGKKLAIGGGVLEENKSYGYLSELNPSTGSVNWTKTIGTKKGEVDAISIDKEGNYLVSGIIENTSDQDARDMLVAKLNSANGNEIWLKRCHGNYPIGNTITSDPSGNIYFSGSYSDTLRIDANFMIGNAKEDLFLTKLNPAGKVLYTRSFGNSKMDKGQKLCCTKNKLLLYGVFSDGLDLVQHSLKGGENSVFLASFDFQKTSCIDALLLARENDNQDNIKVTDINGKLLYGKEKNKSFLSDQALYIEDEFGNTIRRTVTDENGDFSFKNVDANLTMNLVIEKSDKLKEIDEIFVAGQNGIIVDAIKVDKENRFKYKLLPAMITKLEPMHEDDDISLKIKNFKTSQDNEINIVQRITYEPNSYTIPSENMAQLNQIAVYLRQNPKYKLEIFSYTDVKGEDNANMILSQKRADEVRDFLVKKKIAPERIQSKGLGETKLLNRCENDIKCTDMEHSFNRRTEFKFTKGTGL